MYNLSDDQRTGGNVMRKSFDSEKAFSLLDDYDL